MVVSARGVPRFLPTLTEVVQAPQRVAPVIVAAVAAAAPVQASPADTQAIVAWVQAEVEDVLQRKLPDLIANALLEQVDVIAARLREDIEPMVRQAAIDAVVNEVASRSLD